MPFRLPAVPNVLPWLIHRSPPFGMMGVALLAMAAAPVPWIEVHESDARPVAAPVVAVATPPGPVTRQLTFVEPVKGHAVNSKFGMRRLGGQPKARMHKGIDIAAPKGTPIVAIAEGRVIRVGDQPSGYGRFVELRHPNGLTSLYAHMHRVDVRRGQSVAADQPLGQVGSTGFSTGPHLHLEIKRNGAQVNPAKIIGRSFTVRAD